MSETNDILLHYGVARRSGRYPWGSGDDPYQGQGGFLADYVKLRAEGLTQTQMAEKLGMNTSQLRTNITWARKEQREYLRDEVIRLSAEGKNDADIGGVLGISAKTVYNYKNPVTTVKAMQLDNVSSSIEAGVANTGYLDVGVGVERQLGVSRTKFNAVVDKLVAGGEYHTHEIYVKRLSDVKRTPDGDKPVYTTVKVLTKETDVEQVKMNSDKIRPLDSWSDDGAITINPIKPPIHVDRSRVDIRFAEDGGTEKDGLIEVRRGVSDLDMGNSRYAQVRIAVGDKHFLKGMAVYSDDMPKGVDLVYNVTKSIGTSDDKALKLLKDDPENPFGTNIVRQKGALNIINEEGDWDTWSTKMSSQFLSKQPVGLIKDRLDATYAGLRAEYDEIVGLTNPVVKKFLLDKYIDGLDSKAKMLKAQGLPRTKNHVLLPVADMNPAEIFAPNYENGERVVLVRHPHGGKFEIPDLIVNNKNAAARLMIGSGSLDAVGIHPSVAGKLSGADFDGDTALVIPNNKGQVKTARSLKELERFEPSDYKVDYPTITPRAKETMMGVVSNLITDMTIKGATDGELARAVKHSMVVIDSEKHQLDYKRSARENGISALRKKYQYRVNPDTGKMGLGASTLISRSKRNVDISNPDFDVDRYSSGTPVEKEYATYVNKVARMKNEATQVSQSIPRPQYSKEAAQVYAPELKSLNAKLNTALMNAPRERQAQILTNNLYFKGISPDMQPDDHKKLKSRSLAIARETTGAKRAVIQVEPREWEAIQSRAISTSKLTQILLNSDMDAIKKLSTPRQSKMDTAKATRARSLIARGYTYAEVAQQLGVSTSTIREAIK